MFAPQGWIPLRSVYEYFLWYFSENEAIGDFAFTGDECFQLTWYFADEAHTVAVCCANGTVLPASATLVATDNDFDHENLHVDLHLGTVGSGSIRAEGLLPSGYETRQEYINATYGPFLNLPIIFKEEEFSEYLERLASLEQNDERQKSEAIPLPDMSPKALAERILMVWREGDAQTLSAIKEIVAPDQSARQFRFAWGLARMAEPELSKPGRRKRKS